MTAAITAALRAAQKEIRELKTRVAELEKRNKECPASDWHDLKAHGKDTP